MNIPVRIGMDTSKSVFQLHGVDENEVVVVRRQFRRAEMIRYFERLPPVLVAIESCGSSHHWARLLQSFGHEVKLIPPQYVKAYVKRGKNDAADAEALCEAVTRPSMRFVPLMKWHREDDVSRRIATIPGVGPVGSSMLSMKAPPPETFRSGRDFAAWLGLTPKDHSTGGRQRHGGITKAGDSVLRSTLIVGATALLRHIRKGRHKPTPWLAALPERKPPKLVAVARIAWRLMMSGGVYNRPVAAPKSAPRARLLGG